jgi:ABC-2 type transport system permease protein
MTTATEHLPAPQGGIRQSMSDSLIITGRNLRRIPRIPELAIFAIIQSIMFVLLFAFVFGGAIPLEGYTGTNAYREYLLPGIFVQTIVFAAATVAIGMCDDINKGIIDRFRSLPMSRSAVLIGRTFSEVVYNAGILVVLMLAGLAVGWSVHTDLVSFLAGVALLLAFAYAMAWLGVWLGVVVPTVEVAQQVSFTVLFPITFISGVFVPIYTMPDWLQPIAYWNPVTTLASSLRNLWGNPNPQIGDNFPTQNPILVTVIWIVVFIVVFGPLGVRRYRNMSR